MSPGDFQALLPLLVLLAAAVVVMLETAYYRSHLVALALTLLALAGALASLPLVSAVAPRQVTALVLIDSYALFFMGLILSAALAVGLLAYGYLERGRGEREEFYVLLLLATLGAVALVASTHFASFFLALEVLSVSLYTLIGYVRLRENSVEAGVKYLILAGVSAAFLLFGMALVYGEVGAMDFARLAALSPGDGPFSLPVLLAGLAMIVVGFGFKLAVVPFHLWTPDVYQGAPAPVTAFVATVSKGAVFALLLRYFAAVDIHSYTSLFTVFSVIAIASMLVGNLLALFQTNVKRILAYSSISHLGYLLVAFLAAGPLAVMAVAFYLVSYFLATLGSFGVVGELSNPERDADRIDDYAGLFWRRPWLAGVFTAMLLSLAGIPLTVGFIGKFFLVTAGLQANLWWLLVVLAAASVVGLFYYLRVAVAMYLPLERSLAQPPAGPLSVGGGVVLGALSAITVWLGVYPTTLVQVIQAFLIGSG